MLKTIALLLLFLVTIPTTFASGSQNPSKLPTDCNITGHIIDAETGEHMPYYLISLKGESIAIMSDASGHYHLRNLTPGRHTIEVTFTGYKKQSKTIDLKLGETKELNFNVEADAFLLDQVVVTSSKSEQVRRLSPSLVNVVPGKIFDQVGACTLAEGLNFQPGVRVENDCQNCGFTQVRINGLDGHYSQILMNSRPVFSALAGVYGLEHIPTNMIERVEVMRGGGSALFGSSAIGGTINIITKDPTLNAANVHHNISSIGVSGALDNNTTFNASVVTDNNQAGLFFYGQTRARDGYDDNDDGFTEICQLKQQTVGARGFIRTTDDSRLTIEYHNTHEFRRGGDQLDVPAHSAMVAEQAEHYIHSAEATFDLWSKDRKDHLAIFSATQSTNRQSYYGSEMDPNAYGRTSDLVAMGGAQWTHDIDRFLFMPAQLVAGLEYSHNRLHDVTVGYYHDILQRINIYSGYLQNEWRDDRWGFLVGARADKHSLINDLIISPRANIRYNASKNANFRLSYSTGFRAPQAYDEDFHVAIVGGDRVVTVLAKDLKEENSHSISASADFYRRFGNVQTNLLVEAFYTDLSDVFALRQLDQPDALGNAVLERYNGSGARILGFNVEGKVFFSSKFDMQAGITWQRSRYKEPEQWSDNPDVAPSKRIFRTPDFYGYLTANVQIMPKLRANISATYTGSMLVQHLVGSGTSIDRAVETPDYFDASIKLIYNFKVFNRVNIDVNAGISNIFDAYQSDFDKGYMRDSGYMYGPALPRCISAGVNISI